MRNLNYPIGIFECPPEIDQAQLNTWIETIERFPDALAAAVANTTQEQRSWRYRPDGWSVAQVVHHCADSHLNSIARFKLALTEDNPTIRPYFEDRWAKLADSISLDCADSLMTLRGVHARWTTVLRSLDRDSLQRTFVHPENQTPTALDENIGIYAWHCEHHLAHVHQGLASEGRYGVV